MGRVTWCMVTPPTATSWVMTLNRLHYCLSYMKKHCRMKTDRSKGKKDCWKNRAIRSKSDLDDVHKCAGNHAHTHDTESSNIKHTTVQSMNQSAACHLTSLFETLPQRLPWRHSQSSKVIEVASIFIFMHRHRTNNKSWIFRLSYLICKKKQCHSIYHHPLNIMDYGDAI